jgi:RNA polymerase sigma-70 factor, ECF subfamily
MTSIASQLHLRGLGLRSTDDLMLLVQRGDALAFEVLYHRMCPIIRGLIASNLWRPEMVDDGVQEVFCRLWKQRDRFAHQSSAKTYLLGIGINVVRELARDAERAKPLSSEIPEKPATITETEDLGAASLALTLGQARATLSNNQSKAIGLVYDERLAPKEAARLLGCTEKALRRRLEVAREKMRNFLAARAMLL